MTCSLLQTSVFPQRVASPQNVLPTRERFEAVSLIQRCQSGDASAWDALIKCYQKDIYRIALSLSHNHEDAEDVTSRVFMRLFQSLHTYRNESGFRPWLFSIVYHTFLDMCVRSAYRLHIPVEYDRCTEEEQASLANQNTFAPSPENLCLEKEAEQILTKAIHNLPATQRLVLGLYHDQGKSYEEIACETGLAVGTVKSRLNRARKMLRERLIPYRETFGIA